ncbi:hypothetical protein D3C75_1076330 [compost metagenome]
MAFEYLAAHQLHLHGVADLEQRQLGFLEVAVDPVGVAVDHRQLRRAGLGVVAGTHRQVGHVAVHRRQHAGARQIQLGFLQQHLRLAVFGAGGRGGVAGVVAVLA